MWSQVHPLVIKKATCAKYTPLSAHPTMGDLKKKRGKLDATLTLKCLDLIYYREKLMLPHPASKKGSY